VSIITVKLIERQAGDLACVGSIERSRCFEAREETTHSVRSRSIDDQSAFCLNDTSTLTSWIQIRSTVRPAAQTQILKSEIFSQKISGEVAIKHPPDLSRMVSTEKNQENLDDPPYWLRGGQNSCVVDRRHATDDVPRITNEVGREGGQLARCVNNQFLAVENEAIM
jgi:hypothetical protein